MALLGVGLAAVALVSGGSPAGPRTPPSLPGLPPPFLGVTLVGSGGTTAAVDAYGNVVDLRGSGPAGPALIDNPTARQAAGTVAVDAGIVPRVRVDRGPALPLWRADSVELRYRRGTNVLTANASFGAATVTVTYAARGSVLACATRASGGRHVAFASPEPALIARLRCDDGQARRIIREATRSDRRWLSGARPLGPAAPAWATGMYRRSLLVLRALTDRSTGAVVAGARDGWAYVWPRDAGTVALAFAAAGYRDEAKRVTGFLLGLDLGAAARFHGDGTPVEGRDAQGDAAGWVAVAAKAAGLTTSRSSLPWRDRADYQEREPGDYLANAIAAGARPVRLTRDLGDPSSGLDTAAAWAVRPFPQPALFPALRRTLLRLAVERSRFGITPSQDWDGADPWTAPTAWTAWSLAALGERRESLRLLTALRRAATPAGALPERVDARTGIPASTTPLAWSHAFAILALRELWL